jgi:predicted MPP superfamily phosphohydrolase
MPLPNPQRVELKVTHPALKGLKILHLSDLHIHQKMSLNFIDQLVEICQNLEHDFIVITGDIIDCKPQYITPHLRKLNTLNKVFYVSGNHDLFYGIKPLNTFLSNFTFLDNTHTFIEFNQQTITLVGISDRFSRFFNIKRDEKKTLNTLLHFPHPILLAHQPKDYTLALKTHTPLFLCGHTHGGQIFPFHYVVKWFQPFLAGSFYQQNTAIYVNKGLGTWGINFRYKANSEITLLKLTTS